MAFSTPSAPSGATCHGESLGGWVAPRAAVDHPDRIDRLVLNTAGGSQADPEVMKRIITLSMAAAESPTWETVQARIKWLMADKTKDYDDIVASRQRMYRQPGFVAAMSDIMALQDPEIRARNLLGPTEYGAITAPTLVLWTSDDPTADVTRGQADRIDDPRRPVRGDAGLRPLAAVRGPQDVQPRCTSTSCWAPGNDAGPDGTQDQDRDTDVLIVGAGPVGLTLANILGLQGVRTLVVDERDSLIDYPRGVGLGRRGAADLPGDRRRRAGPAAHRAQPDPAVLRRQAPAARRNGTARRTFRLAQAQRLRPADGRRRTAARPGPIRPRRGAVGPPDGVLRRDRGRRHRSEFADGQRPVARALCRGLRRRPQRHPASDGGVVRGHHVVDALAGHRSARTIRSGTRTAKSARIRRAPTCRSRSHTESAASSS